MGGVAEPLCTPVVGIDLWEHAYFAAYEGNRDKYVDDFFKQINW
jgi:Fe-Mn family superoxide dismutase